MYQAVPQGMEFAFTVPLVCRSVENYWRKQFSVLKPAAILLNDDAALFGSFEDYNIFLQCCLYVADVPLERLFVISQHYEKKIYRDNDFEWYTPSTVWEKEMLTQKKEAEIRAEAEANLARRKENERKDGERLVKMLEELKCLKSMK